MNLKQKVVLWIGILIIIVMGSFPPWIIPLTREYTSVDCSAGYHFFLTPPGPDSRSFRERDISSISRIDVPRLLSQWILVAIVTGGLIVTLKDKKKD